MVLQNVSAMTSSLLSARAVYFCKQLGFSRWAQFTAKERVWLWLFPKCHVDLQSFAFRDGC